MSEDPEGFIAVVMSPQQRAGFERVLAERGMTLERYPDELQEGTDFPRYFLGVSDERWRA